MTVVASAASPGDKRAIEQLAQTVESAHSLSQQVVPYDAVFRRDPMRALVNDKGELVTSSGLRDGLWVQGIIWSDEHPLAIVDDELVKPGATIGPYTILQILPDGVIAQRDRKELFIPLDRGLEINASSSELPPLNPPTVQP